MPSLAMAFILFLFIFVADNTTGGMKNLPVVLFDRGISIPLAHARIHKVFYPCNRCHLARLFDNQIITVTTR